MATENFANGDQNLVQFVLLEIQLTFMLLWLYP